MTNISKINTRHVDDLQDFVKRVDDLEDGDWFQDRNEDINSLENIWIKICESDTSEEKLFLCFNPFTKIRRVFKIDWPVIPLEEITIGVGF